MSKTCKNTTAHSQNIVHELLQLYCSYIVELSTWRIVCVFGGV